MKPRLSASLILCRQKQERNFEVLMIKRKSGMSFAEALVFPGGATDPSDFGSNWHNLLGCSTDTIPGTPYSASVDLTGLRLTALRETFEEIGVLFSNKQPMVPEKDFTRMCFSQNIRPSIEKLHYYTRIIAPVTESKRFDTTFFLSIESGHEIKVDLSESDSFHWAAPAEFLTEFLNKKIKLWPPQVYILKKLSQHASLTELFSRIDDVCRAPSLFQIGLLDGNRILSFLPGDYRHDMTPDTIKQLRGLHYMQTSGDAIDLIQDNIARDYLRSLFL